MSFFEGLGMLIKSIFQGFGSVYSMIFLNENSLLAIMGWKWMILTTILLLTLGSSVIESIQQKDGTIIVKQFGSKLFDVDKSIQLEVEKIVGNETSTGVVAQPIKHNAWQWICSYLSILSNLYMIYIWFVVGFKISDFFNSGDAPLLSKIFISLLLIVSLRLIYIAVSIGTGAMSFQKDFDGNVLRLVFPYYGIYLFAKNLGLYLGAVKVA